MMVVVHNPDTVWTVPEKFKTIYSHAAEVQNYTKVLHISGQFGVGLDGSLPEHFEGQCEIAMDNVEALLAAAGLSVIHVAKLTFFVTDASNFPSLGDIRRRRWRREEAPAVTAIAVAALASPKYLIEIEATAYGS